MAFDDRLKEITESIERHEKGWLQEILANPKASDVDKELAHRIAGLVTSSIQIATMHRELGDVYRRLAEIETRK